MIKLVRLQVSVVSGEEAQTLSFSRIWTSPITVHPLSVGRLALLCLIFTVVYHDLACQVLLISHPVLYHLQIDLLNLLERSPAALDGIDR